MGCLKLFLTGPSSILCHQVYDDAGSNYFDDAYDAICDIIDTDHRAVVLMIPGPVGVHVVSSRMPKTGLQYAYNEKPAERAKFAIGLMLKACERFDLPRDELSEEAPEDFFAEEGDPDEL